MKTLFFNDLSIYPLADTFDAAWKRIDDFIQAYKSRPRMFEGKICFDNYLGDIPITADSTLHEFCSDPRSRTLGSLILGLTKHPYIEQNSAQEISYIKEKFYILKDSKKIEVYGLAAAYLHNSIGIGFISEDFWKNLQFELCIQNDGTCKNENILCVSQLDHFNDSAFTNWIDSNNLTELVKSELHFSDKEIKLRDDHGKDVLFKFAQKLVKSPYVVGIVNSLPFNSKEKRFIRNINENGLIELVMVSTDAGYGLIVKTTGRNYYETSRISYELEHKYRILY